MFAALGGILKTAGMAALPGLIEKGANWIGEKVFPAANKSSAPQTAIFNAPTKLVPETTAIAPATAIGGSKTSDFENGWG